MPGFSQPRRRLRLAGGGGHVLRLSGDRHPSRGQADLCSPEYCWPVAFDLEQARTHLTEGISIWANPRVDSLREQMRSVYRATAQERLERTALARQFVTGRFTWSAVAERHWGYCRTALEARRGRMPQPAVRAVDGTAPSIGFVSTWNARCGIAEYTRYLATNLPAGHRIAIFANRALETVRGDEDFVIRSWDTQHEARPPEEVEELAQTIMESGVRAVSIQYNFGFLPLPTWASWWTG